jgi:hypothetical protein
MAANGPEPTTDRGKRRKNGWHGCCLVMGNEAVGTCVMFPIELNPSSAFTLQTQVCEKVRAAIVAGVLRPRAQLPSSREIARELGVSRNTIIHAFEKLADEGARA